MKNIIKCDLCVIGGGMAGLSTAISAARHGVKVVLVQDRNVLGGNASSEIRMWIRGASSQFPEYAEGGLVEELALDNMHYNPQMNFHLWDGVLYNKVVSEKNITYLPGTTCIDAEEENGKIKNITVWELATYKKHVIEADYFADCSGDCVLAEFTSAKFMQGREAKEAFSEDCAVEQADTCTMGNSCMLQLRKTDQEIPHTPFPFEREDIDELLKKRVTLSKEGYETQNFWWLELGGNKDALKDAREINKELLSTNFAVYSKVMEKTKDAKQKWTLDWIGFLAGKRETRRYVGEYVMTANDVEKGTKFPDEIAYGGWPMDDHDPKGLYAESANRNIYPKAPYAIPYRALYSKNIENLFFAGRNISATHMAMSSTRVMATCSMMGQAVGVACFVAKKYGVSPKGVGAYIDEVQQTLLKDDCYLLHTERKAFIKGFGKERNLGEKNEVKTLKVGERLEVVFPKTQCEKIRLVFDSDLTRSYIGEEKGFLGFNLRRYPMLAYSAQGEVMMHTPPSLVKEYRLQVKKNGVWEELETKENFNRLVFLDVDAEIEGVAFTGLSTYGDENIRLFSLDVV